MKNRDKMNNTKSVLQKMFERFALLFSRCMSLGIGEDDLENEDILSGDGSLVVMGVTSKTQTMGSPYCGNVVLCWMRVVNGKTTYVPLATLLTERQIDDMTPVFTPDTLQMTNLFYSKLLDTVRETGGVENIKPERYSNVDSPQYKRDYDFDLFTDLHMRPWNNN